MSDSSTPLAGVDMAVVQATPIRLAEALRRFEAEASPGVCDTGRYRCSYYTWGSGPPIVFIPGLSDDALSFVLVVSLLSRHFRCIAYSLPTGHGDHARLGRYTHPLLVEDLFELLDHLRAPQSYVFGSSFGATIALAAMDERPGRLPRGILQGGFAHRPLQTVDLLLASFGRYLPGQAGAMPLRAAKLWQGHHEPFAGREPDVWEYFLRRWNEPPITAVAHRAMLLHHLDLRPLLPHIHQPVLLVSGDRDPLVPHGCDEEMLKSLPSAGRVELTGCGHNPLFTHPEVLAEVVTRFLTPAGQAVCSAAPCHDEPEA
jgi:pimeloyl-ACP methyl ester carboxylesterase